MPEVKEVQTPCSNCQSKPKTASPLEVSMRPSVLLSFLLPRFDQRAELRRQFPELNGYAQDDFDWRSLPLRFRVVWLVHSQLFQSFMMLLLVLEIGAVLGELLIGGLHECRALVVNGSNSGMCVFFEGDVTRNESGLFAPPHCGVSEELILADSLRTATRSLMWLSVAVLSLFASELLVLMICLRSAFCNVVYFVDTLVVYTSLIFTFIAPHGDNVSSGVNLIIILRIWRFMRVLHSCGLGVSEMRAQQCSQEAAARACELKQRLESQVATCIESNASRQDLTELLCRLMQFSCTAPAVEELRASHQHLFCRFDEEQKNIMHPT